MNTKTQTQVKGWPVKSQIKAGGFNLQHNETLVGERAKGLKVKSQIKAGGFSIQHNEMLVSERSLTFTTRS